MKLTIIDNTMHPYLHGGDEIEFEEGEIRLNRCIFFVRYQEKEKSLQVFKE